MNRKKSFFKVRPGPINKSLEIPPSKSHANRVLCLAALSPKPVSLAPVPGSSDVTTMLECLEKIGLIVQKDERKITIVNSFPSCEKMGEPLPLKSGDGGTTNRFLMALLARGKRSYILQASGRIPDRPMDDLINLLKDLGVKLTPCSEAWIKIQGPCKHIPQKIFIDCSKTTQFYSALSLSLADLPVTVVPRNEHSSAPYRKMTDALVQDFKSGKKHFVIPVDFSSMSYPLALGLTHGRVEIDNVDGIDPLQADSRLIEIAQGMGGQISLTNNTLKADSTKELRALEIDISPCPDLAPTLSYLCSCARGVSTLTGVDVLRYKESDRLREISRLLSHFQVEHKLNSKESRLDILGPAPLVPFCDYQAPDDHRMVMSSYLFMRKNSGGRLSNAEAVRKSFPNFFKIMDDWPLSPQ